jgi:hypothetical protein
MCTTRHEGNIVACCRKASAEVAAEPASPHDDDTHGGIQRGITLWVKLCEQKERTIVGGEMADLGYPELAAIVLGAGGLAGFLAWLTRRLVHIDVLRRHHEIGNAVFLQLGVVFAVLLAFVFSEVWSEYNSAASAIDRECGALNGVIMLSTALPPASRQQMKTLLDDYAKDVVASEFPAMLEHHASRAAEDAFQALWIGAAGLPAERAEDRTIRDGILSLLASAHQNRDLRLFEMVRGLPGLIWLLLSFFVVVLVGFLLFFGVDYVASQMVFTGAFAACLASVLVIVHLLDYPFEGVLRLPPTGFHVTVSRIATLPGDL